MDYSPRDAVVHATLYASKPGIFHWQRFSWKTSATSTTEEGESTEPRASASDYVELQAVQKTEGALTTSSRLVMPGCVASSGVSGSLTPTDGPG